MLTSVVEMVKVPVLCPAGMVMLETVGLATAVLPEVSVTTMPPGAAAHSSVTVPVAFAPPRMGLGVIVSDPTPIGLTLNVALFVAPA